MFWEWDSSEQGTIQTLVVSELTSEQIGRETTGLWCSILLCPPWREWPELQFFLAFLFPHQHYLSDPVPALGLSCFLLSPKGMEQSTDMTEAAFKHLTTQNCLCQL